MVVTGHGGSGGGCDDEQGDHSKLVAVVAVMVTGDRMVMTRSVVAVVVMTRVVTVW